MWLCNIFLVFPMNTDLGTSLIFRAVVKKCSVGKVKKERKTAGCNVTEMLDIMALL